MVENRLKMSQEKTEFIAFGSSHTIEQLQVESIRVGNDPVEISSHVKYLGVATYCDTSATCPRSVGDIWKRSITVTIIWKQGFDMKNHIPEKCRIASLKSYKIKKIRNIYPMIPSSGL